MVIENCFSILHEKNIGKIFGKLMDHFIIGGDKTYMIVSNGNTYIISTSDWKKYKKKLLDSHASIVICRTRNVNGNIGPIIWLLKG